MKLATVQAQTNWLDAQDAAAGAGVRAGTMLAGIVGSVVHGLNVSGVEDYDIMGVCIEPLSKIVGLSSFEQFIYRTADQREREQVTARAQHTAHNARSQADDIDLTIYSLRKYIRLALNGNPSILALLFVPPELMLVRKVPGMELQGLAGSLVSKKAGKAFLGYMEAQKQRLLGERGSRHGVRTDQVNAFGFNSKYAMHILRLGYQGIELMETGKITLPMPEPERTLLREVRMGTIDLNDVLQAAGDVERRLKDAIGASPLPTLPNSVEAEKWMIEQYRRRVGLS